MDQQTNNFSTAPNHTNGLAVGSLVLGIISVFMMFFFVAYIPLFIGIVLGIVAIVLAILAKKKGPSGMATAGLVLGIIGLVLCGILAIACTAAYYSTAADLVDNHSSEIDDALNQLKDGLENMTF